MNQIKVYILLSLSYIVGIQGTYSQKVVNQQSGDIAVNKIAYDVIGEESITNFTITAPSTGDYYVSFWGLPTRYNDGTFSRYKVLVNKTIVGYITTNKGNWQSLSLENNTKITLVKGHNNISIVTNIPEIAEIHYISCSLTRSTSLIPTEVYDSFLKKAQIGFTEKATTMTCSLPELAVSDKFSQTNTVSKGTLKATFSNLPIKYTFWKAYSFAANTEVTISSSSQTKHLVDIFMDYGQSVSTEDLSWLSISEKKGVQTLYTTSKTIKIRYGGRYIIKIRSFDDRQLGVGDLVVKYGNTINSYEDVPIYGCSVDYIIPADGNVYAVITTFEEQSGGDVPLLHIAGGGTIPGKVVAYNIETPSDEILDLYADENFGITDIYIAQSYRMPTKSFHVDLYTSLAPESTCGVKIFKSPLIPSTVLAYTRSLTSLDTDIANVATSEVAADVDIRIKVVDQRIIVTTPKGSLLDAEIYSLFGTRMNNGSRLSSGIYMVKVLGKTYKVMVK